MIELYTLQIILFLVAFLELIEGQTFTLRLLASPGGCYGGAVCLTQPVIAVLDSTNQVAIGFQGSAYIQMFVTPNEGEQLYVGKSCTINGDCGTRVTGAIASVPFQFGVATFSNLVIKTAGTGYQLKIIAQNSFLAPFAFVNTAPFDVAIGPPFKMVFSKFLGTVSGGTPFSPSPGVSIADRGDNPITSNINGYILCYLANKPTTAPNEQLLPAANTQVTLYNGNAAFTGLKINTAGFPYRIGFLAVVDGIPQGQIPNLYTKYFTVGIGPVSQLQFEPGATVGLSNIYAGEFLRVSPRVNILDAGGNLIIADSTSAIQLSIYDNPAGAVITPDENRFAVAYKGKVTFSSLKMNKRAKGVRLGFTLFTYNQGTGTFTQTKIFLASERFEVMAGFPRELVNSISAERAWAGGSPFEVQPKLTLVDYGGNVLSDDYSSVMTSKLVSSPSVAKKIRIDTTLSSVNSIKSVSVSVPSGTYGTGQSITINIGFEFDTWLSKTSNSVAQPYILLNVLDINGNQKTAVLSGAIIRQPVLPFVYTAAVGDTVTNFDYINSNSLILPAGYRLYDGNNNNVDITLPSTTIVASKSINIDTTAPQITKIDSTTLSGEYGEGEIIDIFVTFDKPVLVTGVPVLKLNAAVPARAQSGTPGQPGFLRAKSMMPGIAYFKSINSDFKILRFEYKVGAGENAPLLGFNETRIIKSFNNSAAASIKRYSDNPVTNANLEFGSGTLISDFQASRAIKIDTSAPILDVNYGVRTNHSDGVFSTGEIIFLSIKFDKDVINQGLQISLKVNCGTNIKPLMTYASFFNIQPDSRTIIFKLEVPSGSTTTDLDIADDGNAIEIALGGSTFLRRKPSNPLFSPLTNCDLSTTGVQTGGFSLKDNANIVLKGRPPIVQSVSLVSQTSSSGSAINYEPDSFFIIQVVFDLAVATVCNPILVINAGVEMEAVYFGGNKTNTLQFKYTVESGNVNVNGLFFRFTPNALCAVTGCPLQGSFAFGFCGVYAMASLLKERADLTLPRNTGSRNFGVPLNNTIKIVPRSTTRGTSITKISSPTSAGVYGSGSILNFNVEFNDNVKLNALSNQKMPLLLLNNGKYAKYNGGSNTKVLSFFYIASNNDTSTELKPMHIPGTSIANNNFSPIRCIFSEKCQIINLNNDVVSLNVDLIKIMSTGIILDNNIPRIDKIWTSKKTSPYDNEYTVGEVVDILVYFTRPVIVTGPTPQILMDVNPDFDRTAIYIGIDSTYKILTFRYTVVEGDNSDNLMYKQGEIFTTGGLTKIFLRSELPVVQVDYKLPDTTRQTNLTNSYQYIKINTMAQPKVIAVTALSGATKRYAVGDVVQLELKYNKFIIATGRPYINMNCGKSVCVASYIGYDKTQLSLPPLKPIIPSAPTKLLYFAYQVKNEDFNYDFDYIDQFSFFAGVNDNGGAAWIFQAATNPSSLASRDLPIPGSPGSLASNAQILIDGFAAYLTSIELIPPSGTYVTADVLYLRLNFSASVSVVGSPYIVMETGEYDRPAPYHHGSGTNSLFFRYIPQPGDSTLALDYVADRSLLLSSVSSFKYNGGKLYTSSASPSQEVVVHLNTPGGDIAGTKEVVASVGAFTYLDLSIRQRGPNYNVEFLTAPLGAGRTIRQTQSVFVSFSNEVEIRPKESQVGDQNGYDLDVYNDLSVIGCPNCNVSVTTIQTVTTTGKRAPPQMQVQIVKLKIEPQPIIVSFHTSANVGETVQGYFSITYANFGTTRLMPVNIDGAMMSTILAFDLVRLGNVTVTREPYIYCACNNAFTWTLTFNDLNQGHYDIITVNSDKVAGEGGTVADFRVIQYAADIKGTFKLKAFGRTTREIPYDATSRVIASFLPDIDLSADPVFNIQTTSTEKDGTRSWLITFNAHVDSYDIPLLTSDSSGLTGGKTSVWVKILRPGIHGPLGLSGTFQLEFRGNKTTQLPSFASAADVKAALEALDTINYVNVWRSNTHIMNGYIWTIEFVDYNYRNARNYYRDDVGNVERLVPHNNLIGTETDVVIGAIYEAGKAINIFSSERKGSYGDKAGSIYVHQNTGESWDQVATIWGSNTDENDQFGTSVAMTMDPNTQKMLIIVGAVGADKKGYPEKQSITCKASSGSFKLKFRGWETAWIPFDVKRDDLIFAMVSEPSVFAQLYSMNGITIDDWGSANDVNPGLCSGAGHVAVITFLAPVDGAPHLTGGIDTFSDLEDLTYDMGTLAGPGLNFQIQETQKGTWRPHGVGSDIQQVGAAYIFRDATNCVAGATVCLRKTWSEEAIFYPNNAVGTEKFGTSVSVSSTHAVVGAPGSRKEAGSTYIFAYDSVANKWSFSQEIFIPELAPGDNFGRCVDIQSRTIIVGAPNAKDGRGAVYVFRRPSGLVYFSVAQVVLPPLIRNPLYPGDHFGWSVALDQDQLVVGAPGMDDSTIYVGKQANNKDTDTGGAYTFQRDQENSDFLIFNKLVPTNIRKADRFGYDVAINNNVIAVSAIEDFGGVLRPSKAIIEVMTVATYNSIPLGASFRLKWMKSLTDGMRITRELSYDISASDLQVALQNDLQTGKVIVSRDFVDRYNGGYSWRVTFIGQSTQVSLFEADYSKLAGTNARVDIRYINEAPSRLRGKGHIFQQSTRQDNFIEQLYISPFSNQPVDRCGYSIAIFGEFAFLGCPNRDTSVSNQNAGSGFIFSLSLLHIKFTTDSYNIREGNTLDLNVVREGGPFLQDIAVYIETIPRNHNALKQQFISNLYGINHEDITFPMTYIDYAGIAGTACGRSQDYGSSHFESSWVDGMYDYRGISDFVPLYVAKPFLIEDSQISATIVTNPDTIFEYPNENLTVALHSPGLWPSTLGRLYTTVNILDDMDGIVGNNSYFEKLYQEPFLAGLNVGEAISVNGVLKLLAVGSPNSPVSGRPSAGAVILYSNKIPTGKPNNGWFKFGDNIVSPNGADTNFGSDVALTYMDTRNHAILAVTEPSSFQVHVFLAPVNPITLIVGSFLLDATLIPSDSKMFFKHYLFGSKGTLALDKHVLAIGVPGFESVYVFIRRYDNTKSSWQWIEEIRLRSSEYDYDLMYSGIVLHNQYFGYALSISDRTIVVGSPNADYGKLGTYLVEQNWDTQGETMSAYAKGKAYSFFSVPQVQVITLNAIGQISSGTFTLGTVKDGLTEQTVQLNHITTAATLQAALESFICLDKISVTANSGPVPTGYYYSWTVTFHSEWVDIPTLTPRWRGFGCPSCPAFDVPWTTPASQITVSRSVSKGPLKETQKIQNPNPKSGDKFGAAVSLDGDQLVIGAPSSGSMVATTWDFEAGTLMGWSATGTAFEFQPTYGDNSYYRNTKDLTPGMKSVSSRKRGLYSIATFDKRPGSATDYTQPNSKFPQGSYQGDGPIGDLTSEVFIVKGNRVSFILGGTCDLYQVYVALLIDGLPVDRVTGSTCTDAMTPTYFNLTLYKGRAAQIRIVDNSPVGHINVDDFVFDWDVMGAKATQNNNKNYAVGMSDSPRSGAAFVFLRQNVPVNGVTSFMCALDKTICQWNFETILLASDKRTDAFFGSSVSLNDAAGVIAVGAPGAAYTGFYKEVPGAYPFVNSSGFSTATGLGYPVGMSSMEWMQTERTYFPLSSSAHGVWYLRDRRNIQPDEKAYVGGGAVYVYTKDKVVVSGLGNIITPQHWYITERAKVQPPDEFANDRFGTGVALSGNVLVVGSPGQDGAQPDAGSIYVMDASFAGLKFAAVEFPVLEGTDLVATIQILRDTSKFSGEFTIEYATSDVTAKGVDYWKFEACFALPTNLRGASGCGDYEQTKGFLTIGQNMNSGGFKVRIMNDLCFERYMKYIQVTISIPGSAALQGEAMSTRIRIDDDDYLNNIC